MKAITYIALVCIAYTAHAQKTTEQILSAPISDIPIYDTSNCKYCIFVQLAYGTTEFLNLEVVNQFAGNAIERVDMVFSSFSRTKNFDQAALNHERLDSLKQLAPKLFEEQVNWQLVRQTQCKTYEETVKLFHGFVIRIKPAAAAFTKKGIAPKKPEKVEKPKPQPKPKPAPVVYRDSVITQMNVHVIRKVKTDCVTTGKYLPRNRKKRKAGIRYDSETAMIFWKRREEKICTKDITYKFDTTYSKIKVKVKPDGTLLDKSLYHTRTDETVYEALSRNWDTWKDAKTIVVQDVTASMHSYIPQILLWNEKYAASGVENFVFFNDGDGKPQNQKVLGKIGGLYYVNSSNFEDIEKIALEAISKGASGDVEENNVEALIFAQKKCPDCDNMVMIADHYAPVKDMRFLNNVKKPVHVIICGGMEGNQILPDYIKIAAFTGGSLHTANLDLDLANAKKGEPFEIYGQTFRYKRNKIEEVKK